MFTNEEKAALDNFAKVSDKLFDAGIISTDSFTGEIAEYIICHHLKLTKTARVTRAVDGICAAGKNYQVKAKVTTLGKYSHIIHKIDSAAFDFLVMVYFDKTYQPIHILHIDSKKIVDNHVKISTSGICAIAKPLYVADVKVPTKSRNLIKEFASAYGWLKELKIIRTSRIVGDIGEAHACKHLKLDICANGTQKGFDATDASGRTFEVKTRRVYESGRRISNTRRLNGLTGKGADFLVVVALGRSFLCEGMWLIPMKNIVNPGDAKLTIVNDAPGTRNIVPSKISWLNTGTKFTGFGNMKVSKTSTGTKPKTVVRAKASSKPIVKRRVAVRAKVVSKPVKENHEIVDARPAFELSFEWKVAVVVLLIYAIYYLA